LTTCACTDTSSADTASSQTISLRLHRQRTRNADPLALPAGELVRIPLRMLGRPGPRAQQLGHALPVAAVVQAVQRNGSVSVWPTVMRGLSEE
jgi:hypothetical protein